MCESRFSQSAGWLAELPAERSGVDVGALAGGDQLPDIIAGAGGEDRVAGVGPDRMGDPV